MCLLRLHREQSTSRVLIDHRYVVALVFQSTLIVSLSWSSKMLEHVHVLYDTIPGQSDTASPSECFILRVRIRLSTEAQRYLGLVAPLHNERLSTIAQPGRHNHSRLLAKQNGTQKRSPFPPLSYRHQKSSKRRSLHREQTKLAQTLDRLAIGIVCHCFHSHG